MQQVFSSRPLLAVVLGSAVALAGIVLTCAVVQLPSRSPLLDQTARPIDLREAEPGATVRLDLLKSAGSSLNGYRHLADLHVALILGTGADEQRFEPLTIREESRSDDWGETITSARQSTQPIRPYALSVILPVDESLRGHDADLVVTGSAVFPKMVGRQGFDTVGGTVHEVFRVHLLSSVEGSKKQEMAAERSHSAEIDARTHTAQRQTQCFVLSVLAGCLTIVGTLVLLRLPPVTPEPLAAQQARPKRHAA